MTEPTPFSLDESMNIITDKWLRTLRPNQPTFVARLHWLLVRKWVDFKISTLVYHLLAGTASLYQTDECTLVTAAAAVRCSLLTIGRAWSRGHTTSSVTTDWRPLFCHRWANTVEQSAWTASATGHHLRTVQTIVENVCLVSWAAVPRVWTLRVLTRNLITYLLAVDPLATEP